MTQLARARALITGGSRGIGLAIAQRLAARGAHVILWARDAAELGSAAENIAASGGSVQTDVVDVADPRAVYAAARRAGAIDILINNAGYVAGKPLLDLDDGEIERTFRVNTLAHYWTVRAFLPGMLERDRGHIVTISSAAGICAVPRLADYSASKFASFGFDEALRLELGRRSSKVKTTLVCPYYVDTGMFAGARSRLPWLLPILRTDEVAERVVHAIAHNRRRVIMPWVVRVTFLVRLLPVWLYDAVARLLGVDRSMDHFRGRGEPPRAEPPGSLPPTHREPLVAQRGLHEAHP